MEPVTGSSQPTREACLAHTVLATYERWLGQASPSGLAAFLGGAHVRASLVEPSLPQWRIWGPLGEESFDGPLVARTGHPSLSIRWALAMEILHFSLPAAMEELRVLVEQSFASGFDSSALVGDWPAERPIDDPTNSWLWSRIARRPGMYLGSSTGTALMHFLNGMEKGGDWLGLPPLSGLAHIVETIAARSSEAYGSPFAAYRLYDAEPEELLAWARVSPEVADG